MSTDPHVLFQYSGPLVLLGWLALALSPLAPRLAQIVAGWPSRRSCRSPIPR